VAVIRTIGGDAVMDLLRKWNIGVIFANRSEGQELTGASGASEAALLLSRVADIAVLKDGGRGSYVVQAGRVRHCPAVRTTPIDTTGAGDAFAGAWLADYLVDGDAVAACRAGSGAAARAIGLIGGRPAALP
jgi:sugar/nucleoside kinase (ribokinase family)